MQLTPSQRRALATYQWYHAHRPTAQSTLVAVLWRSSGLFWLSIMGIAVLALLASRGGALQVWAFLLIGVIVGLLVRTAISYAQTIRLWPLLEHIINWEVVEQLLQQPPAGPTPRSE
jgi:hypothetical protein